VFENGIVFVDFWVVWCGLCCMFVFVFEKVFEVYFDIVFGKVDIEVE